MERWIIHVDMDAFYAAVEQRDNPEIRNKPVIVGGLSARGVVATASYEARRFGVHSAMPIVTARRLCPDGIFLQPNHALYSAVSREIRAVMDRFSPVVEPLSLDEAFLDMSGMEWLYPDPVEAAAEIKQCILREVGLTASAGVSYNKFLAKLASDMNKPDGLTVIRPGEAAGILRDLPVSKLWGVGAVAVQALNRLGINTIGQFLDYDVNALVRYCGKAVHEWRLLASGQDNRPVELEKQPKSVGNEVTYETDLVAPDIIQAELLALSQKVGWRLRRLGLAGRTVTVKIRLASFQTLTRSQTVTEATCFDEEIYATVCTLYKRCTITEGIRLLGVTVSQLQDHAAQGSLFDDEQQRRSAVYRQVDNLKERFGEFSITRGIPPRR